MSDWCFEGETKILFGETKLQELFKNSDLKHRLSLFWFLKGNLHLWEAGEGRGKCVCCRAEETDQTRRAGRSLILNSSYFPLNIPLKLRTMLEEKLTMQKSS